MQQLKTQLLHHPSKWPSPLYILNHNLDITHSFFLFLVEYIAMFTRCTSMHVSYTINSILALKIYYCIRTESNRSFR